ncbi:MAG: DEAD/DEAH box helicase [Armatimonadetes bacterium]|nr:DEAD/DEAH box helicase [Armatimonadota bacterium]
MSLRKFLAELQNSPEYKGQLVHLAVIPAKLARYGEVRYKLNPRLCERLKAIGIDKLYSHQAAAINAVLGGRHVVVVTSTASGKTLCYNIPILNIQLSEPTKRAIYLFPTKALAQDQLRKLNELNHQFELRFGIYDGDTPQTERRAIRKNCHTVLTNPDMLHLAILPYHTQWADFFRNLAFVVIDEMHVYRGVFGAHVANIIRRLRRICRHYGSVPQFIACSATIGNPEELMRKLTGVRTEVIDDDGSPSGEKLFAFWNPPYIGVGERRSANWEAAYLLSKLACRRIRSITFAKARVVAELIYRYARANLEAHDPETAGRIMPYRGGYTPEQRRQIEKGLFEGELLGVTATNALELGVDVGDLEACILTGYPGTIASTWQQIGRAGRGQNTSLAILIALNNPLDQFIVQNRAYLLDRTNEKAILDPQNPYILAEHLSCAAYETPISELDYDLFGANSEPLLNLLAESGQIVRQGKWFWNGEGYPAASVNIRSTGGNSYLIYDVAKPGEPLGSVEEATAFQMIHEGAVYLHQGESYVVERLDQVGCCAYASRRDVDYYTSATTVTETLIKRTLKSQTLAGSQVYFGEVIVTEQVIGYKKKRLLTDETLENVDLNLPPQSFDTQAIWLVIDSSIARIVRSQGYDLEGGIHGLEHALIGMMPLYAMCDRQDVGGASHPSHFHTGLPTIFIYDAHPGGVGIAEDAYTKIKELINSTLKAISECPCFDGCPSCIHSPKCGNNNSPLDKQASLLILNALASL